MKVEGSHTFDAPREVVWRMLLDPVVLAQILPGCKHLEQVGENRYEGGLEIKIGPVQGSFDATITLSDLKEPESVGITVNGQGSPGFVNGTGHLRLEEDGERSILRYEGDAQIGGRLAAVGQRLLDASTKAIIRTGIEGLDAQVAAASGPMSADTTASGQTPTPTKPPSHFAFAVGVVRHMISDALGGTGRTALVRKAVLAASLILIIYGLWLWIG
jgi:hypothetical protein